MAAFALFTPTKVYASDTLASGQLLPSGQSLTSNNAAYKLIMQTDGNLVLYAKSAINGVNGRVLWSSGTSGNPGAYAAEQWDGNLVVVNATNTVQLWSSGTAGNPGAYAVVQLDGDFVVVNAPNTVQLWHTNTYNAANTESYADGDCWRAGTPYSCRYTWSGRNTAIYFRAIDQFSNGAPGWVTGAQAAVNAWNNAPGPQYYSFTPTSDDTWVYLKDSHTGQNGLTSGVYGITWQCPYGGPCAIYQLNQAVNAQWSEIYFNHNKMDGLSNAAVQFIFAHESGHAMMLAHNVIDRGSVMYPALNTAVGGPNLNDIGAYPGCLAAGFGIRCIYGSGD